MLSLQKRYINSLYLTEISTDYSTFNYIVVTEFQCPITQRSTDYDTAKVDNGQRESSAISRYS